MVAGILGLLAALPKIFDLVERLVNALSEGITLIRKKQELETLKKASEKAKETKDTSDLDAIFDPRKKK